MPKPVKPDTSPLALHEVTSSVKPLPPQVMPKPVTSGISTMASHEVSPASSVKPPVKPKPVTSPLASRELEPASLSVSPSAVSSQGVDLDPPSPSALTVQSEKIPSFQICSKCQTLWTSSGPCPGPECNNSTLPDKDLQRLEDEELSEQAAIYESDKDDFSFDDYE